MPLSSRPGIGRSRALVAPVQMTTASNSSLSSARGNIRADVGVGDELDALRGHQIDAPLDDLFVELHVGNAVHEQPADAVGAFVNGDLMAGAIELRGAGKARRARSRSPRLSCRCVFPAARRSPNLGAKPLSIIAASMFLIVTGSSLRPEHARTFARRRADPAGEFGKIVGLMQPLQRFLPETAIDQIVPLGNQIIDRAARGHAADQLAGMAKRNAAIHAARALLAQLRFGKMLVKLVPIFHPLQRRTIAAAARARISMNPVGLPIAYLLLKS